MSLLVEIVREQQNQVEECRMLQAESGYSADLGCPLEYRVNQPGNRSVALEEMVTFNRGILRFRSQRPEPRFAIFPSLINPRMLIARPRVKSTPYVLVH